MAGDDGGRGHRRALAITVGIGLLATFGRVALLARSPAVGIVVTAVVVVFFVWLVVSQRRKSETAIAEPNGVATVDGILDFTCLPPEWRTPARETLGAAAASRAPGMSVTVHAESGWLLIDKRRVLGSSKTSFSARVQLAAVIGVEVGKARLGLFGSSLTFKLTSGDEIRVDVAAGAEGADTAAQRFRDAAHSARFTTPTACPAIDVTTAPPPPRTPSSAAGFMMMACFVPFAVAIAGAPKGPFADAATLCLILASLGLLMVRPLWMGRALAAGAVIAATAFAADAARTGQMLRFIGAGVSLALAAWFASQSPRDQPTPGTA